MELAQAYVEAYEGRQPKYIHIAGLDSSTRSGIRYTEEALDNLRESVGRMSAAPITVSWGGEVVGTVDFVTTNISLHPPESVEVEREMTFVARPYEGTISLENVEINRDLLQRIAGETMTASYHAWISEALPNRAERRKEEFKQRQKRDEQLQKDYRKNIRKMMGGTRRWN